MAGFNKWMIDPKDGALRQGEERAKGDGGERLTLQGVQDDALKLTEPRH